MLHYRDILDEIKAAIPPEAPETFQARVIAIERRHAMTALIISEQALDPKADEESRAKIILNPAMH